MTEQLTDKIFISLLLIIGFPGGSEVKASDWNAGDLGSIPGSGRSPGEGNAEYVKRNAGLEEAQAGIKIAGRNINNLR